MDLRSSARLPSGRPSFYGLACGRRLCDWAFPHGSRKQQTHCSVSIFSHWQKESPPCEPVSRLGFTECVCWNTFTYGLTLLGISALLLTVDD